MKKNVVITADENLLGLLYATIEGINEAEGFGRKILHGDKTKHIDRAIREYVEKYGGEHGRE